MTSAQEILDRLPAASEAGYEPPAWAPLLTYRQALVGLNGAVDWLDRNGVDTSEMGVPSALDETPLAALKARRTRVVVALEACIASDAAASA